MDMDAPSAEKAAERAPEEDDGKPDLDEVKRQFRAALERKRTARATDDAAAGGGRGQGKVHGSHGPAASRRSFRRKSG
jgi:hypothetical protein